MSALQTFMLVVDHDKDEAKRIAQGVAQGIAAPALVPSNDSNRDDMQMSKTKRLP